MSGIVSPMPATFAFHDLSTTIKRVGATFLSPAFFHRTAFKASPTMKFDTVNKVGAAAGSILCGSGKSNQGLRLRISKEQVRGNDGAIKGVFEILDVGDNMHSRALEALLGRPTDAEEVLKIIRQDHKGCVHVANTNILVLETAPKPS